MKFTTDDQIVQYGIQHGLTGKSTEQEIRNVFPDLPEHGGFPEFRKLRMIDGIPGFLLDHNYLQK